MGLSRLALHAGIIELTIQGEPVTVQCPLAEDLRTVFQQLEWWGSIEDHL